MVAAHDIFPLKLIKYVIMNTKNISNQNYLFDSLYFFFFLNKVYMVERKGEKQKSTRERAENSRPSPLPKIESSEQTSEL